MATAPQELLRRVPLFSALTDEVLVGLAAHLRRQVFRKGTMIFHKEQAGDALYIVHTGRVRIFLPTESGEELDVDLQGPGDVFGEMALLDGRPRSASAQAAEDTVTYTLRRDDFQAHLARAPELAAALIELLSARVRHLMQYTESLAFHDAHARVARVLLDLAQRYGVRRDGVVIDLPLTQSELARMVGATRERVNRVLASFRAQGLIELRGRRVVLRDPQRLEQRVY